MLDVSNNEMDLFELNCILISVLTVYEHVRLVFLKK